MGGPLARVCEDPPNPLEANPEEFHGWRSVSLAEQGTDTPGRVKAANHRGLAQFYGWCRPMCGDFFKKVLPQRPRCTIRPNNTAAHEELVRAADSMLARV